MITDNVEALLAGRGFDAGAIQTETALQGSQLMIHANRNRNRPALHRRRISSAQPD